MSEQNKIISTELLLRYFAGEANIEERLQVNHWLSFSNDNRTEFDSLKKLWDLTGNVKDKQNINIEEEWRRIDKAIKLNGTKIVSLKRIVQIAASIIIILSISILGTRQSEITKEKTGVSQISEYKLPDGSVIRMNAGSKISYNKGFGKQHREIQLTGEAFFKVTPNKQLPFVISANNTKIEVVGTEFNVKAYKNEIEVKVLVTQGTVKFYDIQGPGKELILNKGETGIYLREQKSINKEEKQDLNDIAWVTRKIEFYNTSLSDVAKILKTAYHKQFEISPSLKNCSVTVSFDNVELDYVLKVLKTTLDLNISVQGDKIIITGAGC